MRRSWCLMLLTSILFETNATRGQWSQTRGIYDGSPSCFTKIGGIVLAGDGLSGIYRSVDNGWSWSQAVNGLTEPSGFTPSAFALTSSDSFAYLSVGNLFRSNDGGLSWVAAKDSGLAEGFFGALVVSGGALFGERSYYSNHNLYVSTDNGDTWVLTKGSMPIPWRGYILASLDSGIYAAGDSGVYVSTDAGSSWSGLGLSGFGISAIVATHSCLVVGTDSGHVFLSIDSGKNWSPADDSLIDTCVTAIALCDSNIYVATRHGLFMSANGAAWKRTGLTNCYVGSLRCIDGTLFAGTAIGGVQISTDEGKSWTKTGFPCATVLCLSAVGPKLFAGVQGVWSSFGYYGGVYKSTDGGANWAPSGLADKWVEAYAAMGSRLFAVTSDGIFISPDTGTTWVSIGSSAFSTLSIQTLISSGSHLIVGTNAGILVSSDSGAHWYYANVSGVNPNVGSMVAVSDTSVFAGTTDGIYHSQDNGDDWAPVITSYPFNYVSSLVSTGSALFAGTSTASGLYRSSDNGGNWVAVNNGLGIAPWVTAFAVSGSRILVGDQTLTGIGRGVFLSTDKGDSWAPVNEGFTMCPVYCFLVTDTELIMGTSKGSIWRRPLSQMLTSVVDGSRISHPGFVLHQNYPNPFNPTTTIRYKLSVVSNVRLEIYDVLGKKIATLVSERQAAGEHSVEFDARKLPSGVYFYSIETGDYRQTRKLLLLK
ncbi:MAG TPA: T9SS type A sorting domain-containing protein [Candidatus Kryptonia bacterium]